MRLKIILAIALLNVFMSSILCQKKDVFPINSNTGLISISNVIEVKGKDKKALKEIAKSYISVNHSPAVLMENSSHYQKKMKEAPKFTAGEVLDSDSLLVFTLDYKIYVEAPLFSKEIGASDDDYAKCNLNFYIKDGKVKYEITNFRHYRFKAGFDAGGGNFENEKPDWKELSGKKRWNLYKEAGITRARLLAVNIERYFGSEHKGQFNF